MAQSVWRLRYGLDSRRIGVRFPAGVRNVSLLHTVQACSHRSIHWVHMALSAEVRRPGREANHSPPSSAEAEKVWSYTSTPHTSLGVVLN
jgi:hypothetical protein